MEGVEEATRAAVENCHRVLSLLTEGQDHPLACKNLMEETGEAISSFNKVVSMLSNDVGHAKLRRLKNPQQLQFNRSIFLDRTAVVSRADLSPLLLQLLPRDLSQKPAIDFNSTAKIASTTPSRMLPDKPGIEMETASKSSVQVAFSNHTPAHCHFLHQQHNSQLFQLQKQLKLHNGMHGRSNNSSCTGTVSSSRSFLSSLSMDGSMGGQGFNLIGGSESASPTNWHLHNRRCTGAGDEGSSKCVKKGWCHCSEKRKLRVRRSIKVPAISNKIADIPSDDYSWRKYGQKPIKGSPHPRGYYKCSSLRGCPARKHVERCVEDPTMLIVTYEGEHIHAKLLAQSVHA